jgi:hypothetical protein
MSGNIDIMYMPKKDIAAHLEWVHKQMGYKKKEDEQSEKERQGNINS